MKLIHECRIRWGPPIIILAVLVGAIIVAYGAYILRILMQGFFSWVLIITTVPVAALFIVFMPVYRTLLRRPVQCRLYTSGMKVGKDFVEFKDIKSISFNTGRKKKGFYLGFGLPVYQRIYVLDKEGREYHALLDIDYFLKADRRRNNVRKIRELLLGMDRMDLISDWAKKH